MRKLIVCVLVFLVSISASGQVGIFTLLDSTMHIKTMSATSDDKVFFDDKTSFFFEDIAHVEFNKVISKSSLEAFQRRGIRVVIAGVAQAITPASPSIKSTPINNILTDSERISQLEESLEAFRRNRGSGKAFEILGALGLGAYFVMSNAYVNDVKKGQTDATPPSVAIPIASCFVMAVGFAIDGGAGDRLRKR